MDPRPVSVIVLTWNGLEVTRRCLDSLRVTEHPDFEIVVVDNGSTDGTPEYLRGLAGIRHIANSENLGFVRGNNVGIRETAGRDVVLLNNDTEVTQADWLSRMQDLAYSGDDIGLVGCRLVNGEGTLVHAWTYMPVPSFWGQEYPGTERDIGQFAGDREVEGVIAACVYIKRGLVDLVGALDEDYFSYYEDTDYCLKAQEAGYRVFCCGGVTVKHLENTSTDLNRMDFSETFRRSREIFISKWKPHYDAHYSRKLTWHSYISGEDLYSRASRPMLWALDRAGVDVNLGYLEGSAKKAETDDFRVNDMKNRGAERDRPQVLFGPAEMAGRADGSFNIAWIMTPYDRFPEPWVREINRCPEVWVTGQTQAESARASGVTGEIVVMPLGVDPDRFNPEIKAWPLTDRFTFLAHFDWGPRTAAGTLLRAFTAEFGTEDRAVLVMMVTSPEPGAGVEEEVESMNLPMDRAPVVFVVDNDIPEYQHGSLYRSADCLVAPQRTADPTPPLARAVACGVPIVTTAWGAAGEMVDGRSVLGVDFGLVPAEVEGCLWAEPAGDSMRSRLREAYERGRQMKECALAASGEIRATRSWDELARRVTERLDSARG